MDEQGYDEITRSSLDYVQPEGYGLIYLYTFMDGSQYVGQTKRTLRKRHEQHLKGRVRVDDRIRTSQYTLSILEVLPFDELNRAEREWIRILGTYRSEHGLNYQPGGNYFEPTDEIRRKMSELKSEYLRTHPEAIEAFIERTKMYWSDPVKHDRHCRMLTEYWSREENRNRQSRNTASYFEEHPEERTRVSDHFKDYYSDKNNLRRMRRRCRSDWNDPDYRNKTISAQRAYVRMKMYKGADYPGQRKLD